MTFDPATASGAEITAALHARVISARDVAEAALARIDQTHAALNAFTAVTRETALADADRVDALLASGRNPGPLAGVPFAAKNLCDLVGVTTVAGSQILRNDPPATEDATTVARLRAVGGLCLGALNMGEFAYDFVTENPHYGPTRNPWDLTRSGGGSSGGSGAAVAAGLVALALGSDTNGSIRVPASFCGLWGLRPTYGAISRGGTFAFVDSLDTIGPFARSVADLAAAFDAMAGPDPRDPACTARSGEPLSAALAGSGESIKGLRLAVLDGYFAEGGEPVVHAAVEAVAAALDVTRYQSLPVPELARTAAYLITAAESGWRHRDRLHTSAQGFDPQVRDRLFAGALTPAAWYGQAQRFRHWWQEQMRAIFETVDVLIAPATPLRAPVLGQKTLTFRGKSLPLRANIGLFTQPVSLVGLPILAAPVPVAGGLPCAVQLIAAPGRESALIRVARALELSGVCAAPVAPLSLHSPS